MIVSLILGFMFWIYLLFVFKKNQLSAFYFMLGSLGVFLIGLFLFFEPLVKFLSFFILTVMDKISYILNFYECYIDYNIIFINYKETAISLYLDYECSGLIEILALTSLILFYPIFSIRKKIGNIILGFFLTCFANIVRLLSICFIVYKFGNQYYYIAHSFIGRIIFYIITMVIYFYMFSLFQIRKQKVGKFKYNS